MTDPLTKYHQSLDESPLKRELARYVGDVEATTKLAIVAMSELGSLHQYTLRHAFATLKQADYRVQAAQASGQLTLETQQELHYLTLAYVNALSRILDQVGIDMIMVLQKASRTALPNNWR